MPEDHKDAIESYKDDARAHRLLNQWIKEMGRWARRYVEGIREPTPKLPAVAMGIRGSIPEDFVIPKTLGAGLVEGPKSVKLANGELYKVHGLKTIYGMEDWLLRPIASMEALRKHPMFGPKDGHWHYLKAALIDQLPKGTLIN